MKILSVNGEDICGISKTLSDAVNKYTKHKSTVLTNVMSVREIPYDYIEGHNIDSEGIHKLAREADIIHFNDYVPESFGYKNIDWYDYIEPKGNAKVVITEHGTVLRTHEYTQNKIEDYAWKLLITMPILFDYIDDERCRTEWLPFPIPTENPLFCPISEENKFPQFTIVHAPGEAYRWPIKDTAHLIETCDIINELKRGAVRLKILTDTPWRKALQIKQRSRVCFDHMQGYYGVNTAEAMSMGIPTIANINYQYEKHARGRYGDKDLPIVRADKVTLKKTLLMLRGDPELLEAIGMESREYAIKVHDLRTAVLPQLMDAYKEVMKG